MEDYYQIHRSTAQTALLAKIDLKEKNVLASSNIELGNLLEEYYADKYRSYIVKEDNLPLEGKNVINNIMEF